MNNLTQLPLPPDIETQASFSRSWAARTLGSKIRGWIERKARQFFSKEEIDQAMTNRRSDSSDTAVIEDFFSFEQPYHIIPEDHYFVRAVNFVTEAFRPPLTLYPIAFPDLRYYPWNLKPNAEAPWNLASFSFRPQFRDLDLESETPKLQEHIESLASWMSSQLVNIKVYLASKARLGYITHAVPRFHNLYNEMFHYNRTLVHQIKDGRAAFFERDGTPKPYYWNTLHARAHVVAQDEPDKIRAVFGATKLLLMIENMFIWQLQRVYLNIPDTGKLLWGREIMKGGWRLLFSEIPNGSTFLTLDWSQFDKRLLFRLMDIVHGIWRSYFDFSRYQPTSFYPNASTNPQRIERLWKWMCYCIKYTPILLPNNTLWRWNYSGFGSGYQQTQLMDSFANAIMITTCLAALGVNIEHADFWIRVQGDDSLIRFFEQMYVIYGPNFLDMLARSALFYFNAKLNAKKSMIQDRLYGMTVLSYFCHFGMPFRTDEDLLRHLLFPEKEHTYPRLKATCVGLAMAACGCSPRFHALCEAIYKQLEEEGWTTEYGNLFWMERTGQIDTIEELQNTPFPDRISLRANAWMHTPRTDAQNERLWPTKPGPRGRFFFLTT